MPSKQWNQEVNIDPNATEDPNARDQCHPGNPAHRLQRVLRNEAVGGGPIWHKQQPRVEMIVTKNRPWKQHKKVKNEVTNSRSDCQLPELVGGRCRARVIEGSERSG